ncbi:MAG: hypothetical protein KAW12_00690, partial [Candidatus Aminicenantes bacterium]|nr:hypothetical protein [Candidatus Aminicenantes bacterium]
IKRMNSAGETLRETTRLNDPLGRMTQYVVKVPGAADEVYDYAYADSGKTVTVTDSLLRAWTVKKNENGQVYEESDPAGNKIEYFYLDGRGNMTKKIETVKGADGTAQVITTMYRYNDFSKIEEITENAGTAAEAKTVFVYDARGNLSGSKDAEGNTISHGYDTLGRKLWTTRHFKDGADIKTEFSYYANDLLKTVTDAHGNITSYEYDDQKRITKITYPDATFVQYAYTEAMEQDGITKYRIVTEMQRNGTVVANRYDKLNRLVQREITRTAGVGGPTVETYEYDGLSRLTKAGNDNYTIERKYDALNRLLEEKQMGESINYTYSVDDNRRKMSIEYPNGRIIERDFDILDRVSKIRSESESITDYSYIGKSYRLLSKQYGNGDLISYLYDQGRRLTTKESKNSAQGLINKYNYGYNKVNMRMYEQRVHDSNRGDLFAYDEVYRLKNIKFNSPDPTTPETDQFEKQKTYQFDKVDNILKIVQQTGGETDEIVNTIEGNNVKLNQYTRFDEWGLSYDQNGNTTQKGVQQFTYDYRNQLLSAQDLNIDVNYKYDPFGRRVEKTTGSSTTKYFYDFNQVIEERDNNNAVTKQYVYGNGIDEILRVDKYESGNPIPYYYHTNAIGSITAITDSSGDLVERISYDTFGMPTFKDANGDLVNSSSLGNEYLFHGRRYDRAANLYYYRARYYDPIMGRFLQNDPLGYFDSMNLYQGFNMNSINFIDPNGDSWGQAIHEKIQELAYVAHSYYASSDSAAVHTVGATLSDVGGGMGSFFNLGTNTGEAMSDYNRSQNTESFLILSATIWGETSEAFLAVYGGHKFAKAKLKGGSSKTVTPGKMIKTEESMFLESLEERLKAYKAWKKKIKLKNNQKPTPEQYRKFKGAHTSRGRGSTLYPKKMTGFQKMEHNVDKILNKGVQDHHLITKKMAEYLEYRGMPGNALRKNKGYIYKSNPGQHIGYEKWHRAYDDYMLDFMERKYNLTIPELLEEIQKYYQNSAIAKRIPGVNLLQN